MDSSFLLTTVATTIGLLTLLRKLSFHQDSKKTHSSSPSPSPSPSSSLSLPSLSLSHNMKHHVFPSFHGKDVRKAFLSHILKEFRSKGIDSFIDNNIERSKSIGHELTEAIRGSRIAIVLLSRNYAYSSWCLNELVEIMRCREELGQIVMTIFYEVDPSDVKKQTGDFEKVFNKTCKGQTKEDIGRWRQALKEVSKIAGYHSSNWNDEAAMIEKITTDISNKLNIATISRDFDGLIGMRTHMEKMGQLLRLDLDEVRMIGIWGPLGIGKSTIARFLFNQVSNNFQLSAIMVNIKGSYPRPCFDEYNAQLQLQSQMLSQMINQKDIMIPHLGVVQERLKDKKVFLVLDDVDRLGQLDALAKDIRWFGLGSRVIITTEDLRVLKAHGMNHIYKVALPSTDEALQILCMYAFGQNSPKDGFMELAWEVIHLVGRLPLGLKVMGSYFKGISKQEWEKTLPNLRNSLDGDIESILKFSYDALCDDDKELFLHIACFFNNEKFGKTVEHLSKRYVDVKQRLDVLTKKSLISMEGSYIRMHSLLVILGREIVRKQSIHEPGQRQFLVNIEEICEVLIDDAAGSRSVIGINYVNFKEGELNVSERSFEKMSNLQFLKLEGGLGHNTWHLPHGLNYLSPKLRLLHWRYFPMTCLPFNVNLEFLVELIMIYSKLEKLWEGTKPLPSLKWMNLSYSKNLKELPNLSTAINLQELNLQGCSSLVELPPFIGNAITNLHVLYLSQCSSLMELPSYIGNATNLQKLHLIGCSSLVKLPSSIGNATNLQELHLIGCSNLVELPSSIRNATNMQKLDLEGCSSLLELPSSIGNAPNLQKLDLEGCSSLVKLPSSIGNATNLQILNLEGCSSLVELPSSIENATNLQILDLSKCSSLVELPYSIGNAPNLQKLDLEGCSSLVELPSSIGNASNLQKINLKGCSSLVELPSSIGNAANLRSLDLRGCSSLVEVPFSIRNIIRDRDYLSFEGCSSLSQIPSFIGNATNLCSLDFTGCSSLVEVPVFIGNLQKLGCLILRECSKLEVLPVNVNLKSLGKLDLSGCSSLKRFPEISTNISYLNISGTAIEEVPLSIMSWSRLETLDMSYCENVKEFSYVLDSITESDTKIQEVSPLVHGFACLRRLILKGCKELFSLPQLPDSLSELNAENCESMERLYCSFLNPNIILNFVNCFKLHKEARDLIIQTSTSKVTVLPGGEIPTYFTHRANGGSLVVKLNERAFSSSLIFKACILLVSKNEIEDDDAEEVYVDFGIVEKQNSHDVMCSPKYHDIFIPLTEHLYIFEFEAVVTSHELFFEFEISSDEWVIEECGVHNVK